MSDAGVNPRKPFYLAVSIGNLDGTMDDLEGHEGMFADEQSAVECCTSLNDEYHALDCYVFHCVPVKRIWHGPMRVTDLKPKKR